MSSISACPQCTLENTYPDGDNFVCADCGFEWPQTAAEAADEEGERIVKDANGSVLQNGDTVVLIKDLKVKGSGGVTLKRGTLVKNIRLTDDPELIECNADKVKGLVLRTEFLKKA